VTENWLRQLGFLNSGSRIRTRLEKANMINYGGIPNLVELGYEIITVVFGKRNY
jgi:hypothetical protein